MNYKKIYITAIIGAGRIGSGFDTPHTKQVLTHAHAITLNSRMKLVALVDTDASRGKREAKRWGVASYQDVKTMHEHHHPDVVVIASPDNTHVALLEEVVELKPKLIICEKPVATRGDEARVLNLSKRSHVPILVNYRRRFDTTLEKLRIDLTHGRYGKVLCANAIYTGGLLHNGSHVIDMARYLFGEVKSTKSSIIVKNSSGESSVGGVVTFGRCPQFYLMTGDGRKFFMLEFDILTEKARLCFTEEGFCLTTQTVISDPLFNGYRILGKEKTIATGLIDALPNLMNHAVNVLDGKEKPRTTVADAIKTQAVCLRLAKGALR
ncbi:MAG: Gfo/Idh/MocA family oxidoreductase [Candidatus Paceibacterota bacterium]|jgi:predicted dehydrogenase